MPIPLPLAGTRRPHVWYTCIMRGTICPSYPVMLHSPMLEISEKKPEISTTLTTPVRSAISPISKAVPAPTVPISTVIVFITVAGVILLGQCLLVTLPCSCHLLHFILGKKIR